MLARKPGSGTYTNNKVSSSAGWLSSWDLEREPGVMVNLWVAEGCEKDWFDRSTCANTSHPTRSGGGFTVFC